MDDPLYLILLPFVFAAMYNFGMAVIAFLYLIELLVDAGEINHAK